ncbi:MAG TPA: ABC transporter permease [Rhabdochlamydiaceae bacterium]|jgi:oligopeptide transport system permease protein
MLFLLKKIVILLCSLFVIITFTFALMHSIPGDPFIQEKAIPEEILNALRKHYGLDQPLLVQYGKYLKGILHCDLGPSFKYQGRTVNEIIAQGFPVSLTLGIEAFFVAVGGGIFLGCLASFHHQRWQDYVTMVIAVLGISVPSFILASFMQYLLAMQWDLLPVARWGSFSHSIMPALSLAALPMAFIARLSRANMVEVLQQDFILTAKAKGLNAFAIAVRHVLKNALFPVIAYLGPLSAAIFTGSFAIEKIFGIPGLGQWFVSSITNRDYTMIMGTTIFYSALLIFCIFIVDVLYCILDPRITWMNSDGT